MSKLRLLLCSRTRCHSPVRLLSAYLLYTYITRVIDVSVSRSVSPNVCFLVDISGEENTRTEKHTHRRTHTHTQTHIHTQTHRQTHIHAHSDRSEMDFGRLRHKYTDSISMCLCLIMCMCLCMCLCVCVCVCVYVCVCIYVYMYLSAC